METSSKARRKPSHDILSFASISHAVLLKTQHKHCLEIYIFRYLKLDRNYAIYELAILGVASY